MSSSAPYPRPYPDQRSAPSSPGYSYPATGTTSAPPGFSATTPGQGQEASLAYGTLRREVQRAAYRSLAWGLVWLIGGLAITVGSYVSADPGGTYVVTWGAVLFGAWKTIRALVRVANPDGAIRKALESA